MSESETGELIEVLEEYRGTVKESNGTKAMQRLATLHLLLHHLGKYRNLEDEALTYALEEIKNFHQITLEGMYEGISSVRVSVKSQVFIMCFLQTLNISQLLLFIIKSG